MNLKKESKIRVLENFYALDYTLFGKPVSKVDTCCPVFVEEYLSVKGALMSLMIEMYKLVKHTPKVMNEKVETKQLMKMARESAGIARENCKKLVISEKGRADVKHDLHESLSNTKKKVNIEKLVQEKIRYKSYSLAVDNLLIGRTIQESKKYDKLNSWDGRILEDAYKVLRDNLVECAMTIIENGEEEDTKKKLVNEISQRTKDLFWWGPIGSEIKARMSKEYKECISKCKGDNNSCVIKCKDHYYATRDKINAQRKKK